MIACASSVQGLWRRRARKLQGDPVHAVCQGGKSAAVVPVQRRCSATLRGDAILRAHPNPWLAIRRFTPRSFAEETLLPYGAYNDLMKLVREREFGRAVGIQGASDKRVQGLTFGACGSRLPVAKWHSCPKTTT